jgi:hypothetical protein
MLFASSRDALRRSLVGIAVEIQGTDYSEVSWESGEIPLYPMNTLVDIYTSSVLDKASRGA